MADVMDTNSPAPSFHLRSEAGIYRRQLHPGVSPILCDEANRRAADQDFQKGTAAIVVSTSLPSSTVLGKGAGLPGVPVLELGGAMEAIQLTHSRDPMCNPSQNWD